MQRVATWPQCGAARPHRIWGYLIDIPSRAYRLESPDAVKSTDETPVQPGFVSADEASILPWPEKEPLPSHPVTRTQARPAGSGRDQWAVRHRSCSQEDLGQASVGRHRDPHTHTLCRVEPEPPYNKETEGLNTVLAQLVGGGGGGCRGERVGFEIRVVPDVSAAPTTHYKTLLTSRRSCLSVLAAPAAHC